MPHTIAALSPRGYALQIIELHKPSLMDEPEKPFPENASGSKKH
jgi:hypothetical protein